MSERRRVTAAVGVAALAGGVAALLGTRGSADLPAAFYALAGILGVAMVYLLYRDWLPDAGDGPPAVERAIEHPTPGDEFDRTLAQFDGRGLGFLPDRKGIHDRLRDLATRVLARHRGCTREEAEAAIDDGEWPDDHAVSVFLRNPDARLPRSWRDRVRELFDRDEEPSDFQELVGRTVDFLATRSEVADLGEGDGDSVVVLDAAGSDGVRTTRRLDGAESAVAADGAGAVIETVDTGRWRVAVPVALAFVGFGIVLQEAAVVLAAAVAIGFAGYAEATAPPSCALTVERSVDDDRPDPGDAVEVTTTVRNAGDRVVPDLRVVDGVPEGLAVAEGSPRRGTALRPGEATTITYSVTARRGVHEFGPAYVAVGDHAGTDTHVRLEPADGGDALVCVPTLQALSLPLPLYEQSGEFLGRMPAGSGEGVEFFATREYRPGDSTTRIDWKRLARSTTDELTTVQFREERAATVALVIDADPAAYLAAGGDDPGAVERSVEAAGRLFGSLLESGDRVGIAALGPTPLWVPPAAGLDHRERVTELLATDPAFPPTPPESDEYHAHWVREFHRRFPVETQVVLLSPLCGVRYRHAVHRLRAFGHPVTVVSPDATVDGTVGQRLVRVERRTRIQSLREAGVRVVDWDPDDDLAVAVHRAAARWSA